MELFVGSIFQNYFVLKHQAENDRRQIGMTKKQSEWFEAQQLLHKVGPLKQTRAPIFLPKKQPVNFLFRCANCVITSAHCLVTPRPQEYAFDVNLAARQNNTKSEHQKRWYFGHCFTVVVYSMIVLNTVSMASTYNGEPEWWSDTQGILNDVFTYFFVCEVTVALIGKGTVAYFANAWNCFDFVVTMGALAELFFTTSLLRAFRIARVMRLARGLPRIMKLLQTLWKSTPALLNVGALLFLLFMIFAVLAVALFGELPRSDALTEHNNFEKWDTAMLTLFRISTGEDWQNLMYAAYTGKYGAGVAILYFVVFVFLATFIVVNMFVITISSNFDDMLSEPNFYQSTRTLLCKHYCSSWAICDPLATQYIYVEEQPKTADESGLFKLSLPDLLRELVARITHEEDSLQQVPSQSSSNEMMCCCRRQQQQQQQQSPLPYGAVLSKLRRLEKRSAQELIGPEGLKSISVGSQQMVQFTEVLLWLYDSLTDASIGSQAHAENVQHLVRSGVKCDVRGLNLQSTHSTESDKLGKYMRVLGSSDSCAPMNQQLMYENCELELADFALTAKLTVVSGAVEVSLGEFGSIVVAMKTDSTPDSACSQVTVQIHGEIVNTDPPALLRPFQGRLNLMQTAVHFQFEQRRNHHRDSGARYVELIGRLQGQKILELQRSDGISSFGIASTGYARNDISDVPASSGQSELRLYSWKVEFSDRAPVNTLDSEKLYMFLKKCSRGCIPASSSKYPQENAAGTKFAQLFLSNAKPSALRKIRQQHESIHQLMEIGHPDEETELENFSQWILDHSGSLALQFFRDKHAADVLKASGANTAADVDPVKTAVLHKRAEARKVTEAKLARRARKATDLMKRTDLEKIAGQVLLSPPRP
eukprot:SAG31_NODE_4062_length_3627_cov_2.972506_2_plen_876_part_00